jgi:transcriptional regulator with XRE-family HTH domain
LFALTQRQVNKIQTLVCYHKPNGNLCLHQISKFFYVKISDKLTRLVPEKGKSINEVARKLSVSGQLLGQYMKGKKEPKPGFYMKWKETFGENLWDGPPQTSAVPGQTKVSRGTDLGKDSQPDTGPFKAVKKPFDHLDGQTVEALLIGLITRLSTLTEQQSLILLQNQIHIADTLNKLCEAVNQGQTDTHARASAILSELQVWGKELQRSIAAIRPVDGVKLPDSIDGKPFPKRKPQGKHVTDHR